MTRVDHGRTCPKCRGAARIDNGDGEIPCPRCKGVGTVYPHVRRETRTGEVIELRADGLYVREKGRRTWYGPISYGKLLLAGARQYVEERKKARRKASPRVRRGS